MLVLKHTTPVGSPCQRARGATKLRFAVLAVFALGVATCGAAAFVMGDIASKTLRTASASIQSSLMSRRQDAMRVAMAANGQGAHIVVVDVDVRNKNRSEFIAATIEKARESVKEEWNARFDVRQCVEEPTRFVVKEVYEEANGPADHRASQHTAIWRDVVRDMMATPRKSTHYKSIFPERASAYSPSTVVLERDNPNSLNITHVYASVKPGKEDTFIQATLLNAEATMTEPEAMRYDFLQNIEKPNKFLIIEVFRSDQAAKLHVRKPHNVLWRREVLSLLEMPRRIRRFKTIFPSVPAAWERNS